MWRMEVHAKAMGCQIVHDMVTSLELSKGPSLLLVTAASPMKLML